MTLCVVYLLHLQHDTGSTWRHHLRQLSSSLGEEVLMKPLEASKLGLTSLHLTFHQRNVVVQASEDQTWQSQPSWISFLLSPPFHKVKDTKINKRRFPSFMKYSTQQQTSSGSFLSFMKYSTQQTSSGPFHHRRILGIWCLSPHLYSQLELGSWWGRYNPDAFTFPGIFFIIRISVLEFSSKSSGTFVYPTS